MLSHTHSCTYQYLPFDTHMPLFLSFPPSPPFALFAAAPHTNLPWGLLVSLFLSLSLFRARALSLVLCSTLSPPPLPVSDSEGDAESDSDSGTPITPPPRFPTRCLSLSLTAVQPPLLARNLHFTPAYAHMTFSSRALSLNSKI